MQLDIAGQAIIKNIHMRAEHHDKERVLGVDIRLVLTTDCDALANFSPTLKAFLYEGPDDLDRRALRMPQLKPLGFMIECENHCLHIADQSYDGAMLHKFEIVAEPDGRVQVAFTASLSAVNAGILPHLAVLWMDETVNIDIEPLQGSLKLVGGEAA